MEKEAKSMKKEMAPFLWLESEGDKKGEAKVKKKEVMGHFFFKKENLC